MKWTFLEKSREKSGKQKWTERVESKFWKVKILDIFTLENRRSRDKDEPYLWTNESSKERDRRALSRLPSIFWFWKGDNFHDGLAVFQFQLSQWFSISPFLKYRFSAKQEVCGFDSRYFFHRYYHPARFAATGRHLTSCLTDNCLSIVESFYHFSGLPNK